MEKLYWLTEEMLFCLMLKAPSLCAGKSDDDSML